ncbi:hypothetical protein WMY93_011725 [Mugilogobius chulae]|uniref:Protein kinase domain-containing protein n=1 Tax=Mugilogobius chulae TaxID=88201 RepID=A0AAW0P786_9GOBI
MDRAPTLTEEEIKEALPENYQFVQIVGSGGFGQVVKCRTRDTHRAVAVKIPRFRQDTNNEIALLRRMMDEGMDQRNIVKFYEDFGTRLGRAMIFEMLDVAIALQVLKDMSYIHGDLKIDNVMVVERTSRPLQVKLIDFGLAMPTSRLVAGMRIHQVYLRPPEVLLGLPLDESFDVWTLGVLMSLLMLDFNLFPSTTEYEVLRVLLKLFGQLPDEMLNQGIKTRRFFNPVGDSWTLKTDNEIRKLYGYKTITYRTEYYSSIQKVVQVRYEHNPQYNGRDVYAAIDLLVKLMKIDKDERITPSEILQHPFICYKVLKIVQNGKFGQMVKCKEQTGHNVTVKVPYSNNDSTMREVNLLQKILDYEMDQQNIVRFIETLPTKRGEVIVMERLTMGLSDYMDQHNPLSLQQIRTIVQQTANALQALSSRGLIHTGVMVENIWVKSRKDEPLHIKLADFSQLIRQKKAQPGMLAQLVHYRAPEVILGLPFDPAIDVWSLGCMLVTMLIRSDMFPRQTEFETLKVQIKLFGQPSDNWLNGAINTEDFFYTDGHTWKLKSVEEMEKYSELAPGTIKTYDTEKYDSVDALIQLDRPHELAECISLVKDMLVVDGTQRITPDRILNHPFISVTGKKLTESTSQNIEEDEDDKRPIYDIEEPVVVIKTRVIKQKPPVFMLVKPALPQNTTAFTEEEEEPAERNERDMRKTVSPGHEMRKTITTAQRKSDTPEQEMRKTVTPRYEKKKTITSAQRKTVTPGQEMRKTVTPAHEMEKNNTSHRGKPLHRNKK